MAPGPDLSPREQQEIEVDDPEIGLKRTRQSNQDDGDSPSSKRAKASSPHQRHSSGSVSTASTDQLLEFAKTRNCRLLKNVKNFLLNILQ